MSATLSTTINRHPLGDVYKCDICTGEILCVMTLVEMKTKVCSNECLKKAAHGKVSPTVITFPLLEMDVSSTPLNRINTFNIYRYLQGQEKKWMRK